MSGISDLLVFARAVIYGEQPKPGEHVTMEVADIPPATGAIGIALDNIDDNGQLRCDPEEGFPVQPYTYIKDGNIDYFCTEDSDHKSYSFYKNDHFLLGPTSILNIPISGDPKKGYVVVK